MLQQSSNPGPLRCQWNIMLIISDLYIAFYHVNMFKCALQASTELRVERLRSFATAAHKYLIYSWNERPRNIGITPRLCTIDVCVCVLWSSPSRGPGDWAYNLTSLSENTQRSNHLQMLEQSQHLPLNYFKTLSVGPAGNRTQASRTVDWHLTN